MIASVVISDKVKITINKYNFKKLLKLYKNVKTYNDFGDAEYIVYTSNGFEIGCIDINTNEVWLNRSINLNN